jgi:hypothetical protein
MMAEIEENYKAEYLKYRSFVTKEGQHKEILTIDQALLLQQLNDWGFAYVSEGNAPGYFVKITDNVIEESSQAAIVKYFLKFIKERTRAWILDCEDNETPISCIENKIISGIGTYFNNMKLQTLEPSSYFQFHKDTYDKSYFYFQNGFVEVSKNGYKLRPYKELQGLIWKRQIVPRDFKAEKFNYLSLAQLKPDTILKAMPCDFARFIYRVANNDIERFYSLVSITGYLLHDFYETALKAVVLTDSALSSGNNGRTGKTLYGKSLGKMRMYSELNGKDFDTEDQRRYQNCDRETQIVGLNDIKQYFPFDMLFNDITEGINVNKKNEKPFTIRAKMLIATNQTVKIEGSSARDRSIEFEFSNHFSEVHKPEKEFGHWFFRDWSPEVWSLFDNFMCFCTWYYLTKGLYYVESINLNARKMRDHTCEEFCEYMEVNGAFNQRINLKWLYQNFQNEYPDYNQARFTQRKFNNWIELYTQYNPNYERFDRSNYLHFQKSNGDSFITFIKSKTIDTE